MNTDAELRRDLSLDELEFSDFGRDIRHGGYPSMGHALAYSALAWAVMIGIAMVFLWLFN